MMRIVLNRAFSAWNMLPINIRQTKSSFSFKRLLKQNLMNLIFIVVFAVLKPCFPFRCFVFVTLLFLFSLQVNYCLLYHMYCLFLMLLFLCGPQDATTLQKNQLIWLHHIKGYLSRYHVASASPLIWSLLLHCGGCLEFLLPTLLLLVTPVHHCTCFLPSACPRSLSVQKTRKERLLSCKKHFCFYFLDRISGLSKPNAEICIQSNDV